MEYPHRIRLRGPWECQPLVSDFVSRSLHLPHNLAGLRGLTGPTRFLRKFGYPGAIDADERVWLMIERLADQAAVQLNGQTLTIGAVGDFEADVTTILGPRNRLEIDMNVAPGQNRLWDDVALEIRRSAYLTEMQVRWENDRLLIAGTVAGRAEKTLELYALVDRRNVAYRTIEAGLPFCLIIADVAPTSEKLRVELVNVSTIWYAWESALPASS